MKQFLLITFFLSNVFLNTCLSREIPIIVISAGKTLQAKSTVGSDITVISNDEINDYNGLFLGELIDSKVPGLNFFQQGGHGSASAIQLRGLPARYTTVFIDGIKMSDPSTPDNRYYGINLLPKNNIESVEILKGNQSSLYGSSAIGGSIHITSKKRSKDGFDQNIYLSNGSNQSNNFNYDFSGKKNNHSYFASLNKFISQGRSAMNDNDENDKFLKNSFYLNYSYDFNKNFKIENFIRYSNSFLEYDEVQFYKNYNSSFTSLDSSSGQRSDSNSTDDTENIYSMKLIYEDKQFKNQILLGKFKNKREVNNYDSSSKEFFYGYRDSIHYLGEYNLNLDTKIVYGLDNDFDKANFSTWATTGMKKTGEETHSQYVDLQFRPLSNFFSTIGFRRDEHSTIGEWYTGRTTLAYIKNDIKYRGSLGTGIKFPTINDMFYDNNVKNAHKLKPEKSKGIDIGFDKGLFNNKSTLGLTLYYLEYKNNISNWAGNTDGGKIPEGYVIDNSNGKIKSKGIEFFTNFLFDNNINLNLSYNYTDAYDGEDCDDPAAVSKLCIDPMPVRIPRHSINLNLEKKYEKFDLQFKGKYMGERRDYGNINQNANLEYPDWFSDVILKDYSKFDISAKYKLGNIGIIFFEINNLFNKDFEYAYKYSGEKRNYNLGFKKKF